MFDIIASTLIVSRHMPNIASGGAQGNQALVPASIIQGLALQKFK